jgi:nucleotide-binding universal stress UspA family protein
MRSLLVALDLGPETERVLARTARLPLATGARVTLLHVVPRPFSGGSRAAAIHDARTSLRRLARGLLAQVPVRSRVRAVVRAGVPAAEIAEVARAARAELIVVGLVRSALSGPSPRLLHGARMAEGPGEGNTDQPAAGTEQTGEAHEGAHS